MSDVRDLLVDWLQAECTVVSEFSDNMIRDWKALVVQAHERAAVLGIEWDDEIVPEYIANHLRWAEEDDKNE